MSGSFKVELRNKYGRIRRTHMSDSPRLSQFDVYIFYITVAQTVEKNAGLGHAWQKMMCLFTDRRGIDANRAPDESLVVVWPCW